MFWIPKAEFDGFGLGDMCMRWSVLVRTDADF